MKFPHLPSDRRRFLRLSTLVLASAAACAVDWNRSELPTALGQGRRVIVVGAGIAGLAAAQRLRQAGVAVQVIEGRDRIGGRIVTDSSLGIPVDLGASWIHGTDGNPIVPIARSHGIATVVSDLGDVTVRSGGQLQPGAIAAYGRYETLRSALKAYGETLSQDSSVQRAVDHWFQQANLPAPQAALLQWWLDSEIRLELGMDLGDLSLWEWDEDEQFAGDELLFPGGFGQVPQALAQGLSISLGQTVQAITHRPDGVTIHTDQTSLEADAAIVTVPLGVLKQGVIQFSPALPAPVQGAIAALTMGTLNKMVVTFPRQFWAEATVLGYIGPDNDLLRYGVNLTPLVGRPALMFLTGGSAARRQESLGDRQLQGELLAALRRQYGATIPEPTGFLRTRWSQDPFSYGAYSNIPVGSTAASRRTLARPISPTLHLAGEATSEYPGTVHGAYLSGLQAAAQLLGVQA